MAGCGIRGAAGSRERVASGRLDGILEADIKGTKMRVAVIFFGLARGVPLTIESIRRNIHACNANLGFSLYTVASLNVVETIYNPRAGEIDVSLDPGDAFLLDADAYALVRQDDAAIAVPRAAAQLQRDEFGDGWVSVRNALHQLASLRRAWKICTELLHLRFDHYLFVRPDLIYLDEIRLADLVAGFRGEGNIALPAWHSHGGFNDRIAFADAVAARHYAERIDLVPAYCADRHLHPETFLAHALERGACKVGALPVRAKRVRAQRAIVEEPFHASVIDLPSVPQRFSTASGRISFSD